MVEIIEYFSGVVVDGNKVCRNPDGERALSKDEMEQLLKDVSKAYGYSDNVLGSNWEDLHNEELEYFYREECAGSICAVFGHFVRIRISVESMDGSQVVYQS